MAVGAAGNGGDGGRENSLPPRIPQVGDKRQYDFDPYELSAAEPSDDEVLALIDPYAPSTNPAVSADCHAQIQLNRGENSAEVARGSGEAPRLRIVFVPIIPLRVLAWVTLASKLRSTFEITPIVSLPLIVSLV